MLLSNSLLNDKLGLYPVVTDQLIADNLHIRSDLLDLLLDYLNQVRILRYFD